MIDFDGGDVGVPIGKDDDWNLQEKIFWKDIHLEMRYMMDDMQASRLGIQIYIWM